MPAEAPTTTAITSWMLMLPAPGSRYCAWAVTGIAAKAISKSPTATKETGCELLCISGSEPCAMECEGSQRESCPQSPLVIGNLAYPWTETRVRRKGQMLTTDNEAAGYFA